MYVCMCRVYIWYIAGNSFLTLLLLVARCVTAYAVTHTYKHTHWYIHLLVSVLCFFINKIAEWRFNLRVVSDATAWKYTHTSHAQTIHPQSYSTVEQWTLCTAFQIVPLLLISLSYRVFDSRCLLLFAVKLNRAYLSSDKSPVKASFLMHNELPGICFTFCERERERHSGRRECKRTSL